MELDTGQRITSIRSSDSEPKAGHGAVSPPMTSKAAQGGLDWLQVLLGFE